MSDSNIPVHSTKTLIISAISALSLAVLLLITVIGPAEFGIDPTGLGKAMGLTVLASSATSNQTIKTTTICPSGEQLADWQDIVVITVPAESGLEYKFNIEKDAALNYSWSTDGPELYFDFHGEPRGDVTGFFESFKEASDKQSQGILKAPFNGVHGWYWENRTKQPVRVTLKTKGQYTVKGLI